MNTKPTNPKDALGTKKAPLHLVPTGPLYKVGLAMLEGGRKYGAHNYRAMGTRASVYYDAAMRHITQWWEGEDVDPDSGIHHLMKAAACLFVQRDSQMMGNDVDDRPIKYPYCLPLDKFNKQAAGVVEKYQECTEPFTEVRKNDEQKMKPISKPGPDKMPFIQMGMLVHWCGCGGVKPIEDNEPEEFEEFTIRKADNGSGWYIILTRANGRAYSGKKFLRKDLKLHHVTGWRSRYDYGQAPGYYKTKDEARDTIRAYKNKPMWVVEELNRIPRFRRTHDWYVVQTWPDNSNKLDAYLHTDLKLHNNTEFGGFYPTKQIAEAYLAAYLEKHNVAG